jgi:hypothetical protein
MIVNSRFAFVHLHKSAGTFFNQFLFQFFPDSAQIGYHFPLRMLPQQFSHLPVLGFVRNPWDFYVSWYSFQMQKPGSNQLFLVVSQNKTLDFPSTLNRLLSLCEDQRLLDEVVSKLPNHFVNSGLNIPGDALRSIFGSGLGLYGFLFEWMYNGSDTVPYVAPVESLRDGLNFFFKAHQIELEENMLCYLSQQGHSNTSTHRHYTSYYNDVLAERVAQADQSIVQQFGYRFGATNTPAKSIA